MTEIILFIIIAVFLFFKIRNLLWKRELINLFKNGSVAVTGLRGRGKDTLFCYVINKRKSPYISNVKYTEKDNIPFMPLAQFDLGGNKRKDFVNKTIKPYQYPYPDKIDYYISDSQIYYPAQDFSNLNKEYPTVPLYLSISRHVGNCNVHFNTQNLNRIWDKFRELADTYIRCIKCKYIPTLKLNLRCIKNKKPLIAKGSKVKLTYYIYSDYESCLNRMQPYPKGRGREYKNKKAEFTALHGEILKRKITFYSPYRYDDRIFKTILEGGAL